MILLLNSHIHIYRVYHAIILIFMNFDTLSSVLNDKGNFNQECTKDSRCLTSWKSHLQIFFFFFHILD
jgi:hypothetical protein